MKQEEKKNIHCGYLHDEEGICTNPTCRRNNPDCQREWEWCEECEGKGYHKPYTR